MSPIAEKKITQLKATWRTAIVSPNTCSSTSASRQRSPSTKLIRSGANRASPTPNGNAHISASRFDFSNASNSSAVRSLTAQTAG